LLSVYGGGSLEGIFVPPFRLVVNWLCSVVHKWSVGTLAREGIQM